MNLSVWFTWTKREKTGGSDFFLLALHKVLSFFRFFSLSLFCFFYVYFISRTNWMFKKMNKNFPLRIALCKLGRIEKRLAVYLSD